MLPIVGVIRIRRKKYSGNPNEISHQNPMSLTTDIIDQLNNSLLKDKIAIGIKIEAIRKKILAEENLN